MTTIIKSFEDKERNQLKVAVLDSLALAFEVADHTPTAFKLALSSPAFTEVLNDETKKELVALLDEGSSSKEIFELFGIFDQFELDLLTGTFNGGYNISKFLPKLSSHLKEYVFQLSAS